MPLLAGVDVGAILDGPSKLFPLATLSVGGVDYQVRAITRGRSVRENFEGLLRTEVVAVVVNPPAEPEPDATLTTEQGQVFRIGRVATDPSRSVFRCEAYS